jgi:CarboxypepD_reg-like domain/TonB-dependent Receptor Plug Domain
MPHTKIFFLVFSSLFFIKNTAFAQTATIYGKVTSSEGGTIPGATVQAMSAGVGTQTDENGVFSLVIPAGRSVLVECSAIGFKTEPKNFSLNSGDKKKWNVRLRLSADTIRTTVIKTTKQNDESNRQKVDVEALKVLPIPSMNVESALSIFGLGARAGSGGELTAQYSVRGGNYDENLVYVNGFEVYRPLLIRNGQQEGLTFPNVDLTRSISFSSGGFEASYGDKMSSVLDVEYKTPTDFRGSASVGILGATMHIEGSKEKKSDPTGAQRFRYMLGGRYKTTKYLLGGLETQGEYLPSFGDVQGYMSYDINKRWKVDFLGNYNTSVFEFKPESLKSIFGPLQQTFSLNVAYEGQEVTDFTTYLTGVSLTHTRPDKHYFMRFLASRYQSRENERFDIIGDYQLGVVSTSGDNAGETIAVIGNGVEHRFGRNYLTTNITNVEMRGGYEIGKPQMRNVADTAAFLLQKQNEKSHYIQWGAKLQNEQIDDRLNEWYRIDSSGYSLNWDTAQLNVKTYLKTRLNLNSMRYSAYIQDTYTRTNADGEFRANVGVRFQYWDYTNDFIATPRAQLSYKATKSTVTYKLAGGLYYQPPFYRELRNFKGELNKDINAQKSAHIVAGAAYDFTWFNRPFKLIGEAYYKELWDLIPYEQDNVRLRYYGTNSARGYATGLDVRVNGEFVPGAESWINLSILRTREQLDGVEHRTLVKNYNTGSVKDEATKDVRRPTDGLVALSMYFADYLPKNKNFKMNLNATIASGLPFGTPVNNIVYRNTFEYDGYHRVDIGFAYLLWDNQRTTRIGVLKALRQSWISAEVLNLTDAKNNSSVSWVSSIFGTQFPVKNRLTGRLINVRLRVDF